MAQDADGVEVECLKRMPTLFEDLQWFWDAFEELDPFRREHYSGPGPIPPGDILDYLDLRGVTDPSFRLYAFRMIAHIDRTFRGLRRGNSRRRDRH